MILYNELKFWLLFLFFNFILFVFNYIIYFKESDSSLFKMIFQNGIKGVFMNPNPDFFRLSIDISILLVLNRYNLISNYYYLLIGYFSFTFIFSLYHYTFHKIYHVNPILINDLRLLKNGLAILWAESRLKVIFIAISSILITSLLAQGLGYFLKYSILLTPNYYTHTITFFMLVLFSTILIRKGYDRKDETSYRFIVHFFLIVRHVIESKKLIDSKNHFNKKTLEENRNQNVKFNTKPNIHLLFIESYGSILLKDAYLKPLYQHRINNFTNDLKKEGWKSKSHLSTSVSLIGPSWLAYTSVLFGKRIDNNFSYEYLLNESKFHQYDTFQKVFQKQGYFSYNLNSSKHRKGLSVPYKQMNAFYGIDQWILEYDINYKGTRYGFQENPPDQYTLNYAHEKYLSKQSKPYILFYITTNSHSPFNAPRIQNKNWKDNNNTEAKLIGNQFLLKPNLNDYMKSINYQFDVMEDFILKKGKKDDIFLLIGDHQPPFISNKNHGLETMIHVISKNGNFIKGLDKYGFKDDVYDDNKPIKHEAIYSIFFREFIRTYGDMYEKLPDYEPDGLQL